MSKAFEPLNSSENSVLNCLSVIVVPNLLLSSQVFPRIPKIVDFPVALCPAIAVIVFPIWIVWSLKILKSSKYRRVKITKYLSVVILVISALIQAIP